MKRFAMILCLMTALLGQKGFANYFGSGCSNWCSDLSFSVYADYLYWKVTRLDHTSGGYSNFPNPAHLTFIQPKYTSGYRVGGAVYYDCIDFAARYTSLRTNSPLSFFDSTNGDVNFAYKTDFQVVDLAFGYTHYFQCHRGYLKPYVGAKLAWLRENFDLSSESFFETITQFQKIITRAYGPMLGIEGSWELARCWVPLSLIARGDVSVLSGAFTLSNVTSGFGTLIYDNNAYSFVAVNDLFIGLGIDICNFSCFDANVQVGYEAQVWNGLTTFPTGSFGSSPTTTGLGLGGLVARLGVMF